MKLTRETTTTHVIRSWERGAIRIGETTFSGDLIVSPDEIVTDWAAPAAERITLEALAPALALEPHVLLIGTGETIRFPDADLAAQLGAEGIGIEIMATSAACRTFNVLVVEGRAVVAALINS